MPHPHETLFTYDNALVASCATSPLAALISRQGGGGQHHHHHHHGSTSDCLTLLQQHASHYNRPAFSSNEYRFWDELLGHNRDIVATQTLQDLSTRHETFLHSVMFVHRHNTDETMTHQVALNRFSDVPMSEFPKVSSQQQQQQPHDSTHSPLVINVNDPMFVHLNNEEIIMDIGAKIRREQRVVVDSISSFVGNIIESIKDAWWWIGGGQLSSSSSSSPHIKTPQKTNELGGLETNNHQNDNNGSGGGGGGGDDTTDPYKTYLNWATTDNPDGVAVVHPPIDQGVCGSCWAISALGTMESSIARNMAYIGYETAYNEAVKKSSLSTTKRYLGQKDDNNEEEKGDDASVSKGGDTLDLEDLRTLAILAAQQVQRKSIDMADLSVQELIDCDTNDQGCTGGNPLVSFYFLHKYGVTSTKNYTYAGTQNVCNQHKVGQPIATLEKWGILPADHENNLEKVIRYIGPVAVGLGAYDPAFLSYSGGVFTSNEGNRCNHLVADHAMLIVGYGEEVARNGTKLKYWICRNSWGSAWGDQGYVKMARIGGEKGQSGICGISRSPSVALGGMFTRNAILDLDENDLKNTYFGQRHAAGEEDNESTIARASEQIRSIIHQIRIRLGLMQKGIMMSTLSGDDKNESNRVVLFSIGMGFIMVGIIVFYTLHKRSRRAARRQQPTLRRVKTADSASTTNTHHSTMGLYHGVGGERKPLLQNSSVPVYTLQ